MNTIGPDEYQRQALTTAIYPGRKEMRGLSYATLGLIGEVAEVVELWDTGEYFTDAHTLTGELGDVAWYFAALADELGYKLSEVDDTGYSMRLRAAPYKEDTALLRTSIAVGSMGNILKKALRDDNGEITDERNKKLFYALCEAWVWYTTLIEFRNVAGSIHGPGTINFQNVLQYNLDKLFSRKERGVLTGDGGER